MYNNIQHIVYHWNRVHSMLVHAHYVPSCRQGVYVNVWRYVRKKCSYVHVCLSVDPYMFRVLALNQRQCGLR